MLFFDLLNSDKNVIVSRRNSGFGDNLIGAANAWRYAKATGRKLVILWAPSRYLSDTRKNAFYHFFDLPDSVDDVPVVVPERLDAASHYLLSLHYALFPAPAPGLLFAGAFRMLGLRAVSNFGNEVLKKQQREEGIVRLAENVDGRIFISQGCHSPGDDLRTFFDALALKPWLAKPVDDFATANFSGRKVVGVHVRYYNKALPFSYHTDFWKNEAKALSVCLDKINTVLKRMSGEDYIVFLSTDSRVVNEFIKGTVERVVTYDKTFGAGHGRELHDELPVETAAASLAEMFLLAKSDVLLRLPSGSWFSHYASLYAKEVIT